MNEVKGETHGDTGSAHFRETLAPIFEGSVDPLKYACALLRVAGIEDEGWDTLPESVETLREINGLARAGFPEGMFFDEEKTRLRLNLLCYAHLIEMDAPYEIIANLLRVRLGAGWTVDPFWSEKRYRGWQREASKDPSKLLDRPKPYPLQKIRTIKRLSEEAKLPQIGLAFDAFYFKDLRNAIVHSDYVLHGSEFRMRKGRISKDGSSHETTSVVSFNRLLSIINSGYAFYNAFFTLERMARARFASQKGKALPYDHKHKGLLEFLVDEDGLLNGWVVHWPNGSESRYRRSRTGSAPLNIRAPAGGEIGLFMGEIHREHDPFSPLVPLGGIPQYTPPEGSHDPVVWHDEAGELKID